VLARVFALPSALALALAASACSNKDDSNLAKMAEQEVEQPPAEVAGPGPEVGEAKEAGEQGSEQPPLAEAPEHQLDADGIPIPPQEGPAKLLSPGAEDERVQLRLALAEGTRYRITTLGMLKLPLIDKPTGFAREEDVVVSDCKGEGAERTCLLTHEYRNYEAEPPAGSGLEADEKQVAELVTSHRVDASGLRITETAVQGEASPRIAKQLAEVHRLFCIRFPEEPVGEGATWRDLCRMRQGGSLVTREVTWRLVNLEAGEDGTRAELEYAGRVRRVDAGGKLVNGEIKGGLYFWVDAGEPHLIRERVAFVLDASKGVSTGTDFRYQFTKVGDDGEELLRTDGKPFDQPPQALNDPRRVPSGTTRDGELPPE
jgi:hypothetical protein